MAASRGDAHDQGEHDANAARALAQRPGTHDDAMSTVLRISEWVPAEYRSAYLDGAASVLGERLLVES